MRPSGGWTACLALAAASAVQADPGSLELRVERAVVAPFSSLELEGARIELLLPSAQAPEAPSGGEQTAPTGTAGAATRPRAPIALLVREARLRSLTSAGERAVELTDCSVEAFGGTSQHRGRIDFAEVPSFAIESQLWDVDTGQLFGGEEGLEAPSLDGRWTLRGRLTGAPGWRSTLEGDVRLDLEGGSLPASNLLRSISTALLRRVPGVARPEAVELPARTSLRHAGATFELRDGKARTDDLRVATDHYVLDAGGHVDVDLGIAMAGVVALNVRGVDRVLSLAGLGRRLEVLTRVPAIPVRATGTLFEPRFESDASALPLAAWKLVPRTLGAARGVAEKGTGALIDAARQAGGLLVPGKAPAEGEAEVPP